MIAVTADTTGASRNVHLYLDVEDEHDWCAFSSALTTSLSLAFHNRGRTVASLIFLAHLCSANTNALCSANTTLPAQCIQDVWYRKTHSRYGLARGRVLEGIGGEDVRPQRALPQVLPESGNA